MGWDYQCIPSIRRLFIIDNINYKTYENILLDYLYKETQSLNKNFTFIINNVFPVNFT